MELTRGKMIEGGIFFARGIFSKALFAITLLSVISGSLYALCDSTDPFNPCPPPTLQAISPNNGTGSQRITATISNPQIDLANGLFIPYVDGAPQIIVSQTPTTTVFDVSGLANGPHNVTVQRNTDGQFSSNFLIYTVTGGGGPGSGTIRPATTGQPQTRTSPPHGAGTYESNLKSPVILNFLADNTGNSTLCFYAKVNGSVASSGQLNPQTSNVPVNVSLSQSPSKVFLWLDSPVSGACSASAPSASPVAIFPATPDPNDMNTWLHYASGANYTPGPQLTTGSQPGYAQFQLDPFASEYGPAPAGGQAVRFSYQFFAGPAQPAACGTAPLTTAISAASEPSLSAVSTAGGGSSFTATVSAQDDGPGADLSFTWSLSGPNAAICSFLGQTDTPSGNSAQSNVTIFCFTTPTGPVTGSVSVVDKTPGSPLSKSVLWSTAGGNTGSSISRTVHINQKTTELFNGDAWLQVCGLDTEGKAMTINGFNPIHFTINLAPTVTLTVKDLSASRTTLDTKTFTGQGNPTFQTSQGYTLTATAADPSGTAIVPSWTALPTPNALSPITNPPSEKGYEWVFSVLDGQAPTFADVFEIQATNSGVTTKVNGTYSADMTPFRPIMNPNGTLNPAKTHVLLNWQAPSYTGGQLVLVGYELRGFFGGSNTTLLTSPPSPILGTSFNYDLSSFPCWGQYLAGGSCQLDIRVVSIYQSNLTGATYRFDSTARYQFNLTSTPKPTIKFDFTSVLPGNAVLSPTCNTPPGNCAPNNFAEPIELRMYATPGSPTDPVVSVTGNALPFLKYTFPNSTATDLRMLLIPDNSTANQQATAQGLASAQSSTTQSMSAPITMNLSALATNLPTGVSYSGGNLTFQIPHPTYPGNGRVVLQSYDVLEDANKTVFDATRGANITPLTGNTPVTVSVAGYPGWTGGPPFTFRIVIRAKYTAPGVVGGPWIFDSPVLTYSISNIPPPTLVMNFYDLQTGQTLVSCNSPSGCAGVPSWPKPVGLHMFANPQTGDPINSVSPGIVSFRGATISQSATDVRLLLIQSNLGAQNGTAPGTAISNSGATAAFSQNFGLDLTGLAPGNPTGTYSSGNIALTITPPTYSGASPGVTRVAYDILDGSQQTPATFDTAYVNLPFNSTNVNVSLANYPGWATRNPNQSFPVNLIVRAKYQMPGVSGSWNFDSTVFNFNVAPANAPVVTFQISSLNNPGTVLANCIQPTPAVPPSPPCSTSFSEPVVVNTFATPNGGTITSYQPSVTGPGNPAPVFSGSNFNYTAKLVSGLLSPTVIADYPVTNVIAQSSLGGTLNWSPVSAGMSAGSEKFSLTLSQYFATGVGYTGTSGSAVRYDWTKPAAGAGVNFKYRGYQLLWDCAAAQGSCSGGANPVLAQSASPFFNYAGDPNNVTIDYANPTNPVNAYYLATKQPNQPFLAPVIVRMVYADSTNNNQQYNYDFPLPSQTLATSGPNLLWRFVGAATGNICTFDTQGNFNCPFTGLNEPGVLTLQAFPVSPAVSISPFNTNATYQVGAGAPVAIPAVNVNPTTDEYLLMNSGNQDATISATDNLGQFVSGGKQFGLDLSAYIPQTFRGTGVNMVTINYTWQVPAFVTTPPVPNNLTFIKLELWWDDSVIQQCSGVDQQLATIANPTTATALSLDYRNVSAACVQNWVLGNLNSQLQAPTYLLATYTDGTNTYAIRSPTLQTRFGTDAAPIITWTATGLLTNNVCVKNVVAQTGDCTQTQFDEPQDLKITFSDPDDSVNPATITTLASYTDLLGNHPLPLFPFSLFGRQATMAADQALFNTSASAADTFSRTQNGQQLYFLNLGSFTPKGYDGAGQSISKINFTWASPVYLTMPQSPNWIFDDIVMHWAIDPTNLDPNTDPVIQSGLKTASSVTVDFASTSLPPALQNLWNNRPNPNAPYQTFTYLVAKYRDGRNAPYTLLTPVIVRFTSLNVTLSQPGVLVSVTSNTVTGKWTLTAGELSQIQGLRVTATDPLGARAATTVAIDLRGQTINPSNSFTITASGLKSNATYILTLQGTYDYVNNTYFDFNLSSFTATTNAAVPPSPLVALGSCNLTTVPLQITTDFQNDPYNWSDSLYAVAVSSNSLPDRYLDPNTRVLVNNPVWLDIPTWLSFGSYVQLDDAGLRNTLAIKSLVQDKNSLLPVASTATPVTTPGSNIQASFPALSSVAYDGLLFGVPFVQAKFQTTFTTNMNQTQPWGNFVSLKEVGTGNTVPVTFLYHNPSRTLTVSPLASLKPTSLYQLDITAGLQDICGFSTTQSFSQQFVTTLDTNQNSQVFNPLDTVRNTFVNVSANRLPSGSFLFPRTRFIAPAGPVTAPSSSIDNSIRNSLAFREVRRIEVLVFNTNINGAPAMGNTAQPVDLVMGVASTALGSPAKAPLQTNGVDPATLDIFYVDPSNNFRLVPMKGANNNGTVTAQITKSGTYILGGLVSANLNDSHAYPVPFKPSAGHTTITFTNLAVDSRVKVFTIMGELVRELADPTNPTEIIWDVKNSDGENVASGVYLFQIKNPYSEKRGKLMIIR